MSSIRDHELSGRRLLIRIDVDVPIAPGGIVADDTRLRAALPTLRFARDAGARVLVAGHVTGRPGAKGGSPSMEPIGDRLAELLDDEIYVTEEAVGDAPRFLANNLRDGQIVLLQNLARHPEELACDDTFSRGLAQLTDIYVNDSFATAHEVRASNVGVARYATRKAVGLLLEKELAALERVGPAAEKPMVAIFGGVATKPKIAAISALVSRVDTLIVGGALAYTFMAAMENAVGATPVGRERIPAVQRLLQRAQQLGVKIVLPVDHKVVPEGDLDREDAVPTTVRTGEFSDDAVAVDIGPRSVDVFGGAIAGARTLVWTGPMGRVERPLWAEGTAAVARIVAHGNGYSFAAGAETVAALASTGVTPFVNHVSSSGPALVCFLEGRTLPGLDALDRTS